MNMRDTIAMRLREVCAGEGGVINQSAVSKLTGVSQTAVGKIAKGMVDPTVGTVETLAGGLGLHAVALMTPADEWELLDCYRSIGVENRQELVRIARAMKKSSAPAVAFDIDISLPPTQDATKMMVGLSRPEKPRRPVSVGLKLAASNGS